MIPRTLTFKTTLRFAVLVTVTTAVVLAAGAWLLDRQMRRGLTLLHRGEADELSNLLRGAAKTRDAVRDRVYRDSQGDAEWFFIQIHDDGGEVLFRSENLRGAVLPDLTDEESGRVVSLPGVGRVQMTEIQVDGWHIQVGSPLTLENLLLQDYARVAVWLVAAAALGGLGMGYAFSRVTLRPVRKIVATARRISADSLAERIEVADTKDELSELASVLNQTLARLESSFEQVRRFSADASHELKTPLALMRLNAERLRERMAEAADEEALDDLLEAVGRMQAVIDRLLFLARADGGVLAPVLKAVRVRTLAEEFSEDAEALMDEAGGKFALAECDEGELVADAGLLRQLLLNLVSNAARVTPPGGLVTLGARTKPGAWRLVVMDEGPGLPPEQLERIFGRFVRLIPAGQEKIEGAGGHGLGLAICTSIAALHGGSIHAENRADGRTGLRVVVELPGPTSE